MMGSHFVSHAPYGELYADFRTLEAAALTRVYDGMAAVYLSGRGEAGKALELFQQSLDLNVDVEGAELQLAVGAFLQVVSF